MAHWKKLFNHEYLGAWDLEPGENRALTIAGVTVEKVTSSDGRSEECPVIRFEQAGTKPIILNITNAKTIEKVTRTPDYDAWKGQNIVLNVRSVQAFGETVEALRVKLERLETVCKDCRKPVTAAGGISAAAVCAATWNRFGWVLCADCARKRQAAREAKEQGS